MLGKQDILPDCLIIRSSVDPIRIKALVEHKPLEQRLAVEEQTAVAHLHAAQAEIALHAIKRRARALKRELQIIQCRGLRTPKPHDLKRKRAADRRASSLQQHLAGRRAARERADPKRAAVGVPA